MPTHSIHTLELHQMGSSIVFVGEGVLEIKCPYAICDKDPTMQYSLQTSVLFERAQWWNEAHQATYNYYFQVQGQMMICYLSYHLTLHAGLQMKYIHVERIQRDDVFCQGTCMRDKLDALVILPENLEDGGM